MNGLVSPPSDDWETDTATPNPDQHIGVRLAFYANHTLGEQETAVVTEHLQRCASCRLEFWEWDSIAKATTLSASPRAPERIPPRAWKEVTQGPPDGQGAASELSMNTFRAMMETLSPRERDVLMMRFGLAGGQSKSLEDVAQILGETPTQIRWMEFEALRKTRHISRTGINATVEQNANVDPNRPRDAPDSSSVSKETNALPDDLQRLSQRERQVLCLIATRRSDREIAEELGINLRTVTTLVTRLLQKLQGVQNRRSLAAYAVEHEWCPQPESS